MGLLEELKKSISGMTDQELADQIQVRRRARRVNKTREITKKRHKDKEAKSLVEQLSPEDIQAILSELGETNDS